MNNSSAFFFMDSLRDKDTVEITAKLVLGVTLIFLLETTPEFILPSLIVFWAVSHVLLMNPQKIYTPFFWLMLAALYILDIIHNPFFPANHHYLLFYLCLIFYFVFQSDENADREVLLKRNIKWVLVLLMFLAGVQKALSSEFIDGSFMAGSVLDGSYFKPIYYLIPSIKSVVKSNHDAIRAFLSSPPISEGPIDLTIFSYYSLGLIKVFSFLVLLGEILVALIFIFVKNRNIQQIALMSLILGIFLTRLECGFLSIVCILGFSLTTKDQMFIRQSYIVLIILFLSLSIVGLAFK